jgi:hypothetical protein
MIETCSRSIDRTFVVVRFIEPMKPDKSGNYGFVVVRFIEPMKPNKLGNYNMENAR